MSQFGNYNFGNFGQGMNPGQGFGGGHFDQFYNRFQNQAGAEQRAAQQGFMPIPGNPGEFRRPGVPSNPGFRSVGDIMPRSAFETTPAQGARAQMGAALLSDYQNLVGAGNIQAGRMNEGLQNMQDAYVGGAQNIRESGNRAFDQLSGQAATVSDAGDQFLADQTEFNKGVLEQSDNLFEQAVNDLESSVASDASAQALGIARQRGQQRNQMKIAADKGDPQAQAALAQMDFETAQQTQQTMSGLANRFNELSSQMKMQRAQNYGQVGMQAGGNINQAGSLRNQQHQTASNLFQQGVIMQQGAEAMANQFLATGMENSFRAIAEYPSSPVSIAAIFSQMAQLDMTPGSQNMMGMPDEYLGAIS